MQSTRLLSLEKVAPFWTDRLESLAWASLYDGASHRSRARRCLLHPSRSCLPSRIHGPRYCLVLPGDGQQQGQRALSRRLRYAVSCAYAGSPSSATRFAANFELGRKGSRSLKCYRWWSPLDRNVGSQEALDWRSICSQNHADSYTMRSTFWCSTALCIYSLDFQ